MGKRFSDYKKALKLIRSISAPGTPVNAPAGTPLAEFQKFAKGDTVITVTRATDSLPKSIEKVAINPFSVPVDEGNQVTVAFSQRVKDDSPVNAVLDRCNHTVADPLDPTVKGFIPSKAIIGIPATSVSNPTSQITGLQYKIKKAKSYTYPYGSATTAAHESVVRTNISSAAYGVNPAAIISFNSEEF